MRLRTHTFIIRHLTSSFIAGNLNSHLVEPSCGSYTDSFRHCPLPAITSLVQYRNAIIAKGNAQEASEVRTQGSQ
jgi:hypothetical protein